MHQRKVTTPPLPHATSKTSTKAPSKTPVPVSHKSPSSCLARLCGMIAIVSACVSLLAAMILAAFHFNEDFGAALTETIVKQVMPRVNATVVVGHSHAHGSDMWSAEDDIVSEEELADPDFISESHRAKLTHKSTYELLAAALDHLDVIEVEGFADFDTMHVLEDSHEGIEAEWRQRVADGDSMCSLLGGILKSHDILSATNEGKDQHSAYNEDAKALVLRLCHHDAKRGWIATKTTYRHYYFHRPSVTKYGAHQWLWDSCFHIMAQVGFWRATTSYNSRAQAELPVSSFLRHIATSAKVEIKFHGEEDSSKMASIGRHSAAYRLVSAILEFRSLFAFQNLETGFVPEMTYWRPDPNQFSIAGYLFGYSDHGKRFTDITQMPMLSFPLQRIVTALKDLELAVQEKSAAFVQERNIIKGSQQRRSLHRQALAYFAPKAALYYSYWQTHRARNGLVSIFHPWESGLDASPMYDPFHGFCRSELGGETVINSKQPKKMPKRSWYSSYIAIVNPSVAECPPHPEDLYPKFISLLYRYKHANSWDMANIRGHEVKVASKETVLTDSKQSNRFEVQDVGVNAVLGYNMKLVLDLLDTALAEAPADIADNDVPSNKDADRQPTIADQEYRARMRSYLTNARRRAHHHDRFHDFYRDDVLLAGYSELFESYAHTTSPEDIEAGAGKGDRKGIPHPIAISHDGGDTFIQDIWRSCVSVKTAVKSKQSYKSGDVSITSHGWSPVEGRFVNSDATRVVQQMMLLLLLSPSVKKGAFSEGERAATEHLISELSEPLRFGTSPKISKSLSALLKTLHHDLRRYDSHENLKGDSKHEPSSVVWGVPTTAVNDLAFEPEDSPLMWRGPSWPTTNWFTIEGLGELSKRLGEADGQQGSSSFEKPTYTSASINNIETGILRTWTLMVHANGFSEYYNPLSGEPLGQKGLGMSLSLIDALWGK